MGRRCAEGYEVIEFRRVNMVDLVGIEPTTSSMPWKRAPSCATGPLLGDTTVLVRVTSVFSPFRARHLDVWQCAEIYSFCAEGLCRGRQRDFINLECPVFHSAFGFVAPD